MTQCGMAAAFRGLSFCLGLLEELEAESLAALLIQKGAHATKDFEVIIVLVLRSIFNSF